MAVKVDDLRARLKALQEERNPFEQVYQDLVDYILPTAGKFEAIDRLPDEGMYDCIYDATATDAVDVLAAGMLSGMTSPARPWFRLSTGKPEIDEQDGTKRWLASTTEAMQRVFLQSNVYQVLEQVYRELGVFGTACVVVLPSERDIVHLNFLTVGEYWISEDAEHKVNTLFRRLEMTAEQMVAEFGIDKVSPAVRERFNSPGERYKKTAVIHAIYPRDDYIKGSPLKEDMPYASVYFEEKGTNAHGGDVVLREEGFNNFPVLAPRWEIHGGNIYGVSPGMKALRPVMGLQVEVMRKGKGIDFQTDPPMMLPDSMEDQQEKYAPGGISYYPTGTNPQGAVPAVSATINLSHLVQDIQQNQQTIGSYFYKDLFTAIMSTPRTNRTAYEVDQIAQERMAILGPVLSRLNQELLSPLIESVFDCMAKARIVEPPPFDLDEMELTVTFESILVQALRAAGITSEDRFLSTVGALMQLDPTIVDNIDLDQVVQNRAIDQGVDPKVMRSQKSVAEIREQRMQAQQAQQQMAQAQQMSQVAEQMTKANPSMEAPTGMTALTGY